MILVVHDIISQNLIEKLKGFSNQVRNVIVMGRVKKFSNFTKVRANKITTLCLQNFQTAPFGLLIMHYQTFLMAHLFEKKAFETYN